MQKLTNECKLEAANKKEAESTEKAGGATSSSLGAAESKKTQEDDASRALSKLSDNFASMPQIISLIDGKNELLKEIRLPNPKKRLKAIVEIKKII